MAKPFYSGSDSKRPHGNPGVRKPERERNRENERERERMGVRKKSE